MTPRSGVLTRRKAAEFVDHPPPQAVHLTHDGVLSTDRSKNSIQKSESMVRERIDVPSAASGRRESRVMPQYVLYAGR
jgi:hypothetical protein